MDPRYKVIIILFEASESNDNLLIHSPYEIEHLWSLSLPLLHALLHGDDDSVGLVVRPVLGALLGSPWKIK